MIAPADGSLVTGAPIGVDFVYPVEDVVVAGNTIPFQGSSQSILAALTEGGRHLIARRLVEGLGFRVIGFRVGRGGYDPSDVFSPLALDGGDTELLDPMYPIVSTDPAPVARYEYPNQSAISFLCRVPAGEALSGIGEIGLYVEITDSPSDPTEVGDRHLFLHCHRPLLAKTNSDVLVWRLVAQYTLG